MLPYNHHSEVAAYKPIETICLLIQAYQESGTELPHLDEKALSTFPNEPGAKEVLSSLIQKTEPVNSTAASSEVIVILPSVFFSPTLDSESDEECSESDEDSEQSNNHLG